MKPDCYSPQRGSLETTSIFAEDDDVLNDDANNMVITSDDSQKLDSKLLSHKEVDFDKFRTKNKTPYIKQYWDFLKVAFPMTMMRLSSVFIQVFSFF